MRVRMALTISSILLTCQGCAPIWHSMRSSLVQPAIYPHYLTDIAECQRDRELAEAAWEKFACKSPTGYSEDFEKGFKDGFVDYLFMGGTGAPPPVPPRHYWDFKYETPAGQRAAQDWFAGFRAGAENARESGIRKLVLVPASTVLPSMLPQPSEVPPTPQRTTSRPAPGSGPPADPEVVPDEVLGPPRVVPEGEKSAAPGQPPSEPKLPDVPAPGPASVPLKPAQVPRTGPVASSPRATVAAGGLAPTGQGGGPDDFAAAGPPKTELWQPAVPSLRPSRPPPTLSQWASEQLSW